MTLTSGGFYGARRYFHLCFGETQECVQDTSHQAVAYKQSLVIRSNEKDFADYFLLLLSLFFMDDDNYHQ